MCFLSRIRVFPKEWQVAYGAKDPASSKLFMQSRERLCLAKYHSKGSSGAPPRRVPGAEAAPNCLVQLSFAHVLARAVILHRVAPSLGIKGLSTTRAFVSPPITINTQHHPEPQQYTDFPDDCPLQLKLWLRSQLHCICSAIAKEPKLCSQRYPSSRYNPVTPLQAQQCIPP